jgi:cytochrome P450
MSTLSHIPGSTGLPYIGDTFRFLKQPIRLFQEKQQRYGDIFKYRLLGREHVCLMGPTGNRFVLIEQAKIVSSKEGWILIQELFHGGLMLRDGEEHKHHRGILQTAFRREAMVNYLQVMDPVIRSHFSSITTKREVLVFPLVKELTLLLAGKVFFNLDLSGNLQYINEAIMNLVKASVSLPHINLPFTLYGKALKSRKLLKDFFSGVIKERRRQPTTDMLGNLCTAKDEQGNMLSDEEIIDHLIFFIMAAHDTTASSITSILYELAAHINWQQQLREEAIALDIAGGETVSLKQLESLEKLDWVIKETLRLHPPLMLIPRKSLTEMQFEGVTIPAGTNLTILIHHNHYTQKHWANATEFNPQRFSPVVNEVRKCPHATYIPFGAGQHFCLGHAFADLQMKLVMHYLLKNFRWKLPDNYQPQYISIPIQHPKDGLRMKLQPV